jgi:hypothetical protein
MAQLSYLILNRSLIQMFVRIIIPPAAEPWIDRLVISLPMLVEVAHIAEPAVKVTTAPSKMILRPQRSESFAHTGVVAALDRR